MPQPWSLLINKVWGMGLPLGNGCRVGNLCGQRRRRSHRSLGIHPRTTTALAHSMFLKFDRSSFKTGAGASAVLCGPSACLSNTLTAGHFLCCWPCAAAHAQETGQFEGGELLLSVTYKPFLDEEDDEGFREAMLHRAKASVGVWRCGLEPQL
eukprot:363099-Chlamydomonas_euryale.AAC.2